jgi:acylphosphatase
MKKRLTIVISGDVQDVGFRGKVMRMGHKAGLVGQIENLSDGTVRIISEGEEKVLRKFWKLVETNKGDIEIEDVKTDWERPKGKFKGFAIKYSDQKAEMAQAFSTAGKKLDSIGQKVDGVGDKIDSMHTDMNTRFDTLESRYGEIGQDIKTVKTDMAKLTAELHNSTEALISITQKVGALIDKKLAE